VPESWLAGLKEAHAILTLFKMVEDVPIFLQQSGVFVDNTVDLIIVGRVMKSASRT
jgi:hypothetical protein